MSEHLSTKTLNLRGESRVVEIQLSSTIQLLISIDVAVAERLFNASFLVINSYIKY